MEILERMMNFLKDTDKKYKGKNILIISHEGAAYSCWKAKSRDPDKIFIMTDRIIITGE